MTPKFEICVISRNEVKTLPRLASSLSEYLNKGGIVNLLDTGSHDGTPELAKSLGFIVQEVGERFLVPITNAKEINERFVVDGEEPIVKEGDKYFDFSEARNFCAEMATQPIIFWYDSDEVAERLDIDYINDLIGKGFTQFEYFFCFAKDQFGNEAVKFIQCKAYDKRVMRWSGKIHELVVNIDNNKAANRVFIPEDKYKLAHYQNHEQGRHSYISGLSSDCIENPKNDRHIFYLSRELLYNNRPKSALKGFKQHIAMNGWHSERSESLIHCGDICGQLNDPTNQMLSYAEAFHTDSGRNAALVKLALYYKWNKNYQAAICYAKAALEVPYNGFYADNLSNYREVPHEVLYSCLGFMGRIEEAQVHLQKCLEYQPLNPSYLRDTQYFYEYPDNGIEGWMSYQELSFLNSKAKEMGSILEIGSWQGRSSHALLSGCKGTVTCVDTFQGTEDPGDLTYKQGEKLQVYDKFLKNVGHFPNLQVLKMSSKEASEKLKDIKFDMIFIDANHSYEGVKEDIEMWKGRANVLFCGHDYTQVWLGVKEAVDECVGEVGVRDSIWYKNVV